MNVNKEWVLKECPKSLIEAIGLHSLLFNLGFSLKDEIFFLIQGSDVGVLLRAQGKEAAFRVGRAEYEAEKMDSLWRQLIKQWNTGGSLLDADKDKIYWNSKASRLLPRVIQALIAQGFVIDPEKAEAEQRKTLVKN